MTNTVNIKRWYFTNADKDYDIFLITNKLTMKSVVIRRWGKTSTRGQSRMTDHTHEAQAQAYIDKCVKTRHDHDYQAEESGAEVSYDGGEAAAALYLQRCKVDRKMFTSKFTDLFNGVDSSVSDDETPHPPIAEVKSEPVSVYSEASGWGSW